MAIPLKYAKITMGSGTIYYYKQIRTGYGNRSIEADIHASMVGNDEPTILVYKDETLTGKKVRIHTSRIEEVDVIGPVPE